MMGEGEWKRNKHGVEYRRQWRKLHTGLTHRRWRFGHRGYAVTPNSMGDAPVLPSLLGPKRVWYKSEQGIFEARLTDRADLESGKPAGYKGWPESLDKLPTKPREVRASDAI